MASAPTWAADRSIEPPPNHRSRYRSDVDLMPNDVSPRVEWLTVSGDPACWRSLGFVVTDDGLLPLHGTSLRIVASVDPLPSASRRRPIPRPDRVERERTRPRTRRDAGSRRPADQLGRTDEPGLRRPSDRSDRPRSRRRDDLGSRTHERSDRRGRPVVHSSASGRSARCVRAFTASARGLIVELVERPEIPDGPAAFWGLVVIVADLDAACDLLGPDRISAPKDAVQPGRRIATIRSDAGLGLPVALMTS